MKSLVVFLGLAIVLLPASCQQPNCDREMDAQVLILGAGMAGLSAARTLSENGIDDFLFLEQRSEIGGRVQSVQFAGTTVELGPQWVLNVDRSLLAEDQLHPLWPLVERCNITTRDVPLTRLPSVFYNSLGIDISQAPELLSAFQRYFAALSPEVVGRIVKGLGDDEDLTVAAGLREGGWWARTQIEKFVQAAAFEGGPARSVESISYRESFDPAIASLRGTVYGPNPQSYVVTDSRGYIAIAECLADEFLTPNDDRFIFETSVQTVSWGDECVCAMATKNGENREYCAPYAILTFSTGVLTTNGVTFLPELPIAARLQLQKLEMSNFLKIYTAFNDTFWDTGVDFIFYFDEINGHQYYSNIIPWGDFFPHKPPILETILFGDTALRIAAQDLEITKNQIAQVLRNIYGDRASDPVDIIMHDFITNRYFLGDFSTPLPGLGRNARDELSHPFGRLYLAGEAYLHSEPATANAGVVHGAQQAERIVQSIQGPLTVTFVNDSPKLEGNSITAQFTVSRDAVLTQCVLIIGQRMRVDCSSGEVTFPDLEPGDYTLRVIARNSKDDRTAVSRRIFISDDTQCAVHLINSGLFVYRDNAKVEFTTTGLPVANVTCSVDSKQFTCTNPLELRDLESGRHRVTIRPNCEGNPLPYSAVFNI